MMVDQAVNVLHPVWLKLADRNLIQPIIAINFVTNALISKMPSNSRIGPDPAPEANHPPKQVD